MTKNFLQRNGLQLVVRSHEVKEEGYEVEHDGCCITIFSAPNYCDTMGNKGAFIRFEADLVPHFTSFDAVVRACTRTCAHCCLAARSDLHVWACMLCVAAAPVCAPDAIRKPDAVVHVTPCNEPAFVTHAVEFRPWLRGTEPRHTDAARTTQPQSTV